MGRIYNNEQMNHSMYRYVKSISSVHVWPTCMNISQPKQILNHLLVVIHIGNIENWILSYWNEVLGLHMCRLFSVLPPIN
jgi:methyl coenzyme M reductase subunit C